MRLNKNWLSRRQAGVTVIISRHWQYIRVVQSLLTASSNNTVDAKLPEVAANLIVPVHLMKSVIVVL